MIHPREGFQRNCQSASGAHILTSPLMAPFTTPATYSKTRFRPTHPVEWFKYVHLLLDGSCKVFFHHVKFLSRGMQGTVNKFVLSTTWHRKFKFYFSDGLLYVWTNFTFISIANHYFLRYGSLLASQNLLIWYRNWVKIAQNTWKAMVSYFRLINLP